jgi:hypothetical protein
MTNGDEVRRRLTQKPYVIIGHVPIECCGDVDWRGRTCPYHSGWEDAVETVIDMLDLDDSDR